MNVSFLGALDDLLMNDHYTHQDLSCNRLINNILPDLRGQFLARLKFCQNHILFGV